MKRLLAGFVLGVVATVLLALVGTYTYFGRGMAPVATSVTDDTAGETYWKVANGIRLTGMPGFEKSLSTEQMWQVSLLLANADKLPARAAAALASGVAAARDVGAAEAPGAAAPSE